MTLCIKNWLNNIFDRIIVTQTVMKENIIYSFWSWLKIASLGRQELQPAGRAKWPSTLRFEKILGTTSVTVVRSIENPRDVLQKIHRP